MTREGLIEVMARAIAQHQGEEWQGDMPAALQSREWSNVEDNLLGMAQAALSALEAAGVRLVPVEPSRHMLVAAHMVERDDIELTEDEHRAMYAAFVAASPYALPGG